MDLFLLLASLAGLWFGTELAIRGAVSIAKRFGVSEFIVGVAILSIGSDLPELAIAIDGAIKILGGNDVSTVIVGSALGSSLGQIGFVLGIIAFIAYLTLPLRIVHLHGGILLGSILVLGLLGADGVVTRAEGLALLVVYSVYLIALFTEVKPPNGADGQSVLALLRTLTYLAIGLVLVVGSAELTVTSAQRVAASFGVSDAFVAIVIIGLGTSLPELSISVGAVLKGRYRMSVGNLIGSTIFDVLVPIGVAAAISGLRFERGMFRFEVPYLFALSLVVLLFFARRRGIKKHEAAIILAIYVAYVLLKFYGLDG